jgi:hypothetical protein
MIRQMAAVVMVLGCAGLASAQTLKLVARPLTAQEAKLCPTGTRPAYGINNTGVGQPLYLDAMISKGVAVTSITWTLLRQPLGSTNTLQTSPVTNTLAAYDRGDQNSFDVVSRKMLIPDVQGVKYDGNPWTGDYDVKVEFIFSNRVRAVTNTFYGSTYYGIGPKTNSEGVVFENLCLLCHYDKTNGYFQTGHATAYTRKINGEAGNSFTNESRCVSCHVLGYDTTAAANNGGFDDVARQTGWTHPTNLMLASTATNWNRMSPYLQGKANIQCENCHGASDEHARSLGENLAGVGISLSAGNCGVCHDSLTHHVKNYQWGQTLHATGYVFRATSSCAPCHSAKGFVDAYDADFAATNRTPRASGNEGVTCATCHDPHGPGMGAQLRSFTSVTLANGYTNTLGGVGLLCMQCHHDRYDAAARVVLNGTRGAADFLPHHSPQGDMLIGKNGFSYGLALPSSRHINVLEDSCVECHMQETPTNGPAKNMTGAHTFSLSWTDGTNTVEMTETCAKCHGEIEGFNFGGEDYDRDGVVEGVQQEVKGLMAAIAARLPDAPTNTLPSLALSFRTNTVTLAQRKAAYNYMLAWEDRSYGVHNPKYITALLQASLDDLNGGIDFNRDGLNDAWQVQYWGDAARTNALAAPSADEDGDGLTNLQEYRAGTNPRVADSDGDGFNDLVELQGGSNPGASGSQPVGNMVNLLNALELSYLPTNSGMGMHFQSICLTEPGATWTNIGSGFTSATNTYFYQLVSIRDCTQKFYRVTSP